MCFESSTEIHLVQYLNVSHILFLGNQRKRLRKTKVKWHTVPALKQIWLLFWMLGIRQASTLASKYFFYFHSSKWWYFNYFLKMIIRNSNYSSQCHATNLVYHLVIMTGFTSLYICLILMTAPSYPEFITLDYHVLVLLDFQKPGTLI